MNPFTFFQIGTIAPPDALSNFDTANPGVGIATLLNAIMIMLIAIGGVYSVFNFILAGMGFITAGGDPGKIEKAWTKIWQSIVGLLISAGAFTLATLVGKLVFNDYTFLIQPILPTL